LGGFVCPGLYWAGDVAGLVPGAALVSRFFRPVAVLNAVGAQP
jgi:hypothetical protein